MCAIALLFDCAISNTVLTKSFMHFLLGQCKKSSTEMFGTEAEQDEVAGLAENDKGADKNFFLNFIYFFTCKPAWHCTNASAHLWFLATNSAEGAQSLKAHWSAWTLRQSCVRQNHFHLFSHFLLTVWQSMWLFVLFLHGANVGWGRPWSWNGWA